MSKKEEDCLPTVNKTMFEKGNWQAFTAVVKYIDLFDKANCPAFIAVQKPRCRSNEPYGATTQPMNEAMALNSDDPPALRRSTRTIDEAYGAQHSRFTRGMMFQDR